MGRFSGSVQVEYFDVMGPRSRTCEVMNACGGGGLHIRIVIGAPNLSLPGRSDTINAVTAPCRR